MKQKVNKITTQVNGKYDISSADKINKKYHCRAFIKREYIYSSIEDSEVELVLERNNAGLKKLSQVLSEQTGDSSAFPNAT
jgi:hypothetical protein